MRLCVSFLLLKDLARSRTLQPYGHGDPAALTCDVVIILAELKVRP
jgi:hypothetical protein